MRGYNGGGSGKFAIVVGLPVHTVDAIETLIN